MITSERPIVFLDSETTGLDVRFHEIWELALVIRRPESDGSWFRDTELVFQFWPQELPTADPQSLAFNRFWDRVLVGPVADGWGRTDQAEIKNADSAEPRIQPSDFPQQLGVRLSKLLTGAHLVAANPSFDEPMLNKLLERLEAPWQPWHYHKLDVEAMAIGWLCANAQRMATGTEEAKRIHTAADNLELPYRSGSLAEACGVHRDRESAHTALADARWVRDWFDVITK